MSFLCEWGSSPIDWSATAAWAQAFFSVVAIAASVWLVNRQHRREVAQGEKTARTASLGRLSAVEAEITLCSDLAATYIKDEVIAPAYRLPRLAYDNALPALLSDGAIPEVLAISQFYVDALSFNLCLDSLQTAVRVEPSADVLTDFMRSQHRSDEITRARIKALHLMRSDAPERAALAENLRTVPSRLNAALSAIAIARTRLQPS